MSTNKASLPRVPKGLPKDQEQFFAKVREVLEIQAGKGRGDPLDRAITFRDWLKANGTMSLRALSLLNQDLPEGGLFNDPDPFAPTGVECLPTIETVLVMWDRVTADWYASTEVFRAYWPRPDEGEEEVPRPTHDQAILVGSVASPFYTDYVTPDTRFVYWVRHVNRDGVAGPYHDIDGTVAITYINPIDVIKEYSQDVYNSEAYRWIRSSTGMMEAIHRAYIGAGLAEDSGLLSMLGRSDNLLDLLAEQAMADSLDKAQHRFEIQAQFAKNYARLSGGIHAAVNNDEAYVNRIAVLESNWDTINETINAQIQEYDLTLSSEAGAIATSIDTYKVTMNGVDVSLQELASAVATADGNYASQWGVKTSVAGLQRGVGFVNNGTYAEFVVDADRFAVTGGTSATDDTPIVPFIVRDGKVFMNEAYMDTAVIASLIAEDIVAGRIVANAEIVSPVVTGGSITGTTLDINAQFTVDANGYMVAQNATITGHIDATSGTLENVTIAETCTVLGTVYAYNIEGDVYDATAVDILDPILIGPGATRTIYTIVIKGVPHYDRRFTTAVTIDHDNGGGSTSICYPKLLRDGQQVQSLTQEDNTESGQITSHLSCIIPKGTANVTIKLQVKCEHNDNVRINPQSLPAAVFKQGGSFVSITT